MVRSANKEQTGANLHDITPPPAGALVDRTICMTHAIKTHFKHDLMIL